VAAPAYRAIATLAYGARTNATGSKPTGTVEGDRMYAWFGIGASTAITPTAPTGWELVSGTWPTMVEVGGFKVRAWCYTKPAGASEPSTYTWTHTSASSFLDIVTVTNGTGVTTVVTQNLKNFPEGGTTSTYTGITTKQNESLILLFHHDWGDKAVELTPPTGTTPTFTRRFTGALAFVASGTLTTAGATGNKTMTNNSTGSDPWVAIMIAVEPPSEGGKAWKLELADTVTATDALVKGSAKSVADTVTGSDAVAKAIAKPLVDSVAAVDAIAKLPGKPLSESVTASDALTKQTRKGLSDAVTGAEAISKAAGKTLADSVTAVDAVAKVPSKAIADSIVATDSIAKQPKKALADSVTASDSLGKRTGKVLADVVAAVESWAKRPTRILFDAVTASDSVVARIVEKLIPLAERPTTLALADSGAALALTDPATHLALSASVTSLALSTAPATAVGVEDRSSALGLDGPGASLRLDDREAGLNLDG
jgi:hypothetical protein